jgi:hypothetical protein
METPELMIIERRQFARLSRQARFWWAGWVTASFSLLVTACLLVAGLRVARDIRGQRAMIEELNDRQAEVTRAQVAAWENQQSAIRLITSWAEYVKDRTEISADNGPALPKAPSKQSRLAGK